MSKKKKVQKKKVQYDIKRYIALCVFVIFISVFFIYTAIFLTQTKTFAIKKIEINELKYLTHKEVLKFAQIDIGDNLLSLNLNNIRINIKSNIYVFDAQISRQMPDIIKIKIKERNPIALIKIFGICHIIDDNGHAFGVEDYRVRDLPVIEGITMAEAKAAVSGKKTKHYKAVLDVLKISKKKNAILKQQSIKKIIVDKNLEMKLIVSDQFKFNKVKEITIGYNDYLEKIKLLTLLYESLSPIGQFANVEKIDLNHPVGIVVQRAAL